MICVTFLLNLKTSSHLSCLQTMQKYISLFLTFSQLKCFKKFALIIYRTGPISGRSNYHPVNVVSYSWKKALNNLYAVNGVILPLVKNVSDLGITIDNNLDFKLHINNICVKAIFVRVNAISPNDNIYRISSLTLISNIATVILCDHDILFPDQTLSC